MEIEPSDQFHGHHNRFVETLQPTVQLHSMDIQPSVSSEQRMEVVNQPPPFLQPQPTFTNRHPLSFHHGPSVSVAPHPQMPQQQQASTSPVSSPEIPKKTKKKKEKKDSPSNSPKGRGRYACLLHRQKHKRCPPDCSERKPKPMKSPVACKKTSPRKAKLLQSNQIELGGSGLPSELPVPRPARLIDPSGNVERPTWESAVSWEDLQWNELNPVQTWNAWDDLKSSSHWEESKKTMEPKVQEFDPNSFLMDERLLQLSDSPEGGAIMGDVKMAEL